MNQEQIGKFIASLRKSKNMTQNDLSEKLYTSRENISKWERGINMPPPDMLLELSEMFSVSVNEILIGERKSKKNYKRLQNVPIEILKDSNRKIKKTITYFLTVLFVILFSFFAYYFVNSYNTIKVYKVAGAGNEFSTVDGLILTSKQKTYIKLGSLKSINNYTYDSAELYFMDKNNKEVVIYRTQNTEDSISSYYKYNQFFTYNELDYILKNLYLRVTYDSKQDITKLELKKDMVNDGLLLLTRSEINKNQNMNEEEIKSRFANFKYNEKDNCYYTTYTSGKSNYEIYYYVDSSTFQVIENNNNNISITELYTKNMRLTYYTIDSKGNMDTKYVYDINNDKCIEGDCDAYKDHINDFKIEYYSKYFAS